MLILGGSSDATALASALAGSEAVTLSLAGRTRRPAAQPLPTRVGGFGGTAGLVAYLEAHDIGLLIDATHPFAETMSAHARQAAAATGTPLVRVEREAWRAAPGDLWREVDTMDEAVAALGEVPVRAFLTIGRQRLGAFLAAPFHSYLIRTIDPATEALGLPRATLIEARPPFDIEAETALMRDHAIDVLVTKNSGGDAAYGKIAAARTLGLPVVMLRRPPAGDAVVSVARAVAMVEAHVALRGV